VLITTVLSSLILSHAIVTVFIVIFSRLLGWDCMSHVLVPLSRVFDVFMFKAGHDGGYCAGVADRTVDEWVSVRLWFVFSVQFVHPSIIFVVFAASGYDRGRRGPIRWRRWLLSCLWFRVLLDFIWNMLLWFVSLYYDYCWLSYIII
jgi:hypothetical protein